MVRLVEGDRAKAEKERQAQLANLKRLAEMSRGERRRAGVRVSRRVIEAWIADLEEQTP